MSATLESIRSANRAMQSADDAWSVELRKTFGRNAGNARYTQQGMGAPGTQLRSTYYGFMGASMEWHACVGWDVKAIETRMKEIV